MAANAVADDANPAAGVDKNLDAIEDKASSDKEAGTKEDQSNEESKELNEEEKAELESYRKELEARYAQLDALIRDNEDPSKSQYPPFTKTDSTLKRNTAFVKKLKSYTEAQRETLMRELPALNLTKYLEEVANALLEAKLRATDLPHVLLLNCLLHRNYAEYSELALDAWRKQLPTLQQQQQQQQLNLAKLRVDLRLFADLVLVRVVPTLPGLKLLGQCLQRLTAGDAEFSHCGLVCHLLGHAGDAFVGRLPTGKAALAAGHRPPVLLPRADAYLDADARRQFQRLLTDYCKRLTSALTAKATELAQMDRTNRRILNTKGELSQDRRDAFEACKKEVDRLLGLASQLCNLLGESPPELPPIGSDDLDEEERAVADAVSAPAGAGRLPGLDEATGGGRFEDEDSRQFYEMLPDLRPMLPEVLVREAKERMESAKQKTAAASDLQPESAQLPTDDSAAAAAAEEAEAEATEGNVKEEGEEAAAASTEELLERELEAEEAAAAAAAAAASADTAAAAAADDQSAIDADDAAADESSATTTAVDAADEARQQRLAQLEQFLGSLPTLVNRDLIDKAAIQFATSMNSKAARRRLAQSMLSVHRSRCDLLPFYARLAAVLRPVAPELGLELADRLQREFKHLFHKRDHTNLESKLKVVRFIGELVKFGLCPPTEAASHLKLLVINFSNHSVEMACALLESCGRFLYATPETHLRLKVYLRNLWNKKIKIVTDERLTAMIENAYYSVVPPDTSRLAKAVQLPPVMQFVQKLLFKDLCNATVEKVLNLCLRLPWDDPEIEQFVVNCFTSVWCVPYGSVHCLASVLAGLAPYHQSAAIAVVDNLLEDIRLGMEINAHRLNQRRVACARYLGELYNYCLVESGLVFNTLYSFITLGAAVAAGAGAGGGGDSAAAATSTMMDPPEHLLRIRLACVLLETCGQYFDSGSNKKRLDAYLLYLQQYYWYKRQHPVWSTEDRPFPLDMEYFYTETVDSLRPKFKHASSFLEAKALVEKQEKAFLAKLERVAAKLQQQSKAATGSLQQQQRQQQQLQPIPEGSAAAATTEDDDDAEEDDDAPDDDDEDGDEEAGGGGKRHRGRRTGGGASQSEEDGGGTSTDAGDAEADADASPNLSRRGAAPRPELLACPEDDDFVRAFERLQQSSASSSSVPPASALAGSLLADEHQSSAASSASAPAGTIGFTVMTRRGAGSRHQPVVQLPADSRVARRYLAEIEADARERQAVKRATLNITEAQMMMEEAAGGGGAADEVADGGSLQQPSLLDWRSSSSSGQSRRGGHGRGKPAGGRHF